ncbi:MAG: hypothetical protein IPN23_02410 [Elusimicrobia bacterium]|nr:hypothetical protein [Elusimicrobiota bacterium]
MKPVVLTLGTFDGVHRGHQALLARARQRAHALKGEVLAVAFERPPRVFFRPDTVVPEFNDPDREGRMASAVRGGPGGTPSVRARACPPLRARIPREGHPAALEGAGGRGRLQFLFWPGPRRAPRVSEKGRAPSGAAGARGAGSSGPGGDRFFGENSRPARRRGFGRRAPRPGASLHARGGRATGPGLGASVGLPHGQLESRP